MGGLCKRLIAPLYQARRERLEDLLQDGIAPAS
jgi:hypothetical protein